MDGTLEPRRRGALVDALGSAVFHGGGALQDVPALLRRVLEEDAWRDFETPQHAAVHYDRFEDFVTTPPSRGLGADVALIRRIVGDDLVALDLLDQALTGRQGERTDLASNFYNNVQEVAKAPTGNTSDAALRRLRSQRPDLHERVLARELSPHAAMIEAGFRPRRIPVNFDNPQSAAATILENGSPAFLEALRRLLNTSEGGD